MRKSLIPPGIEARKPARRRREDGIAGAGSRADCNPATTYHRQIQDVRATEQEGVIIAVRCSTCRPRQGRKASLLVAARFGSWRPARESWNISMSYEPISQWKVRIGIAVGLIPIAATRVYYVREMLAALIIFSALFALVAASWKLGWMEKRGKGFARASLRLLPARSTGLSGSRKHDSRPRLLLLCPGHEKLGLERHWHPLADSEWRPHA
jgi:hypothetical protein